MSRADSLPAKSVNQYRSRDIFAYLALRYYSETGLARTNDWAENNATQTVLGSKHGSYLKSYHFKQIDRKGNVEYRELYIPSASEALAEATLLAACAEYCPADKFAHVFSYRPTVKGERNAYFQPYMVGLRERQAKVAQFCSENPDGIVAYVDISKFYPSITIGLATERWTEFCESVSIPEAYLDLGLKLLSNYHHRSGNGRLLTGPMFSHFVANLVLAPIDRRAVELPVRYLRYVDDMTLVGTRADVEASLAIIESQLQAIGLALHPLDSAKSMIVPAREWLDSAADYLQGEHAVAWMKLIGDIKKLLLFDSSQASAVEDALSAEGFRLPVPDYALAVNEATAFQRVRQLGLWQWLRLRTKRVSIDTIVADARKSSRRITTETLKLLRESNIDSRFQRKRMVSKLRYRLGRLIYLGLELELQAINDLARTWPELKFHVAIIDALITSDCYEVVTMGSNVAQAAAQVLRPTLKAASFSRPLRTEAQIQGLAVLILNGVPVEGEVRTMEHPVLRFALGPIDEELMSQPRGLVQELACLHGMGEVRHPAILESAFDIDDNIVLDALEMDYGYYL